MRTTFIMEKAAEWNAEVCFGLADFEKAFGTVEHEMLRGALIAQGVGNDYVWLPLEAAKKQAGWREIVDTLDAAAALVANA